MIKEKKFLLIFNPAANMGRAAKMIPLVEEFFNKWKINYHLAVTKRPYEAENIAREKANKYDIIVVLGGDGTINEVVNGLIGKNVVLAIVPLGSGNDFAKALGLKKKLKDNLEIILMGQEKKVDIGQVNQRYFVNVLGIGFDALVAQEMFARPRFLKGLPVYFYSLLKALKKYNFINVKIISEKNIKKEKELLMLAIANGNFFGGGFKITPRASIVDGFFDICLVEKMTRGYLLKNISKLIKGIHHELPEVNFFQSKNLVIESKKELPVEYDGEILKGQKKLEIKILPQALKVITLKE
ncbi:MAG: diacylglycerol kinase family protein [Patescibacteria group bacterium]|nr:diacylglycerol kinase family protein [Patescibacteria group bacterium]